MKRPVALVLRCAGTNCDLETANALALAGAKPELTHINQIKSGKAKILDADILVIPGGFSYGDDVAAGRILANELKLVIRDIKTFVRSGRPVMGICNGFQVLVKTGILPQTKTDAQNASFIGNDSSRFEARWSRLRINTHSNSLFVKNLPEMIELPVAHAEGKFVVKSPKVLEDLKRTNSIVLRYVNEAGEPAGYPYNPNGSVYNIAAVSNPEGNVLGIMPHPERFITRYHHPNWTRQTFHKEGIGLEMFRNAVTHVQN